MTRSILGGLAAPAVAAGLGAAVTLVGGGAAAATAVTGFAASTAGSGCSVFAVHHVFDRNGDDYNGFWSVWSKLNRINDVQSNE